MMNQALEELRRIGKDDPFVRDLIQHWIERWVLDLRCTSVITYEALKHIDPIDDYKKHMKKSSYRNLGEAADSCIEYEERFVPSGYMPERMPLHSNMDLSVPADLRMNFNLKALRVEPKEE